MTKTGFLIAAAIVLLIGVEAMAAGRLHPESTYQDAWCKTHGGETEVRMGDGTRADCVTENHALEFEFADNWSESVGQALHYSLESGKRGGIVLIAEDRQDADYLERLHRVIGVFQLPISMFVIPYAQ